MVKRLSAKDARNSFSDILGRVYYGKETVIVEKQGKPMVAIIDIEQYEKWMAEREARFKVFHEIWAKNKDKDPKQVERDVAKAIAEVRAAKRAKKA